jgi:tetratricopeptide (TPR) repeat protein
VGKTLVLARAICTVACVVLLRPDRALADTPDRYQIARYRQAQLAAGAKTLPLAARLAYRDAVADLRDGDTVAAEKHLFEALTYDPQYADPYLTLTRVKAAQFDPEAAVYFLQAFAAIVRNFSAQSLLALNVALAIPYVLTLVCLIVCLALALKYLPFAAHRVREFLQGRMHAANPGLCAYLILLLPLILGGSVLPALAYLTVLCWLFMHGRERLVMMVLFAPIIIMGFAEPVIRPLASVADPKSLTSLAARANDAAGDPQLIKAIERTPAPGIEAEKNLAMGLLHQRAGNPADAADHFYRAISLRPEDASGYINLGNVYFSQGSYGKALEGYRKAEEIEPMDAVCQHALAQAYIKTLLMTEASRSLQLAATLGIEKVKSSYATDAVADVAVFPKTLSPRELWRMATLESKTIDNNALSDLLVPVTRFPTKTGSWILLATIVAAVILARLIDRSKLTFQCSNCGTLTCVGCCNMDRETPLCRECAGMVEGVTSEKVTDALLRQKRLSSVVNRRKSSRFATMLLPGMRDVSYGRISRGFALAILFSVGVVQLVANGYVIKDETALVITTPLWKPIVAAVAIVLAYALSLLSKPQYNFRAYRASKAKARAKEAKGDPHGAARVA